MTNVEIYTVGGTVQAGGGLYIPRRADEELLGLCRTGAFAYVLSSRQMGKSSLMVRTIERLGAEGLRCVSIDLNQIGTQVTAEQWYLGLLTMIETALDLRTPTIGWWRKHTHLGVTQRLSQFFQEVLLAEVREHVVIFIDEIDTTLGLSFTDDFYAAIRSLHNARARNPALGRLSFVLIGVATPSDLIGDPRRTPFNIGQRVDVTDFTLDEALPLAEGLGPTPAGARATLEKILGWTGGHPYLTQRLCSVVAGAPQPEWGQAAIDRVVASTFFGAMSDQDQNLQFVRDMLTKGAPAADRVGVLLTYREIHQGFRPVRDEEQSLAKTHLKLAGAVRREGALLRVRNPIYGTVFDSAWVKEHLPANWTRAIYTVGGTVQAGDGVYITRKADKDLLGACLSSDYAYVLGPRQVGKSSLVTHTAERLMHESVNAVVIRLGQLAEGEALTTESWYPRLLSAIADQLLLETDVAAWWQERPHLSIPHRLTGFFQELALVAVTKPVVIFLDDLERLTALPFADSFYSALRYLATARENIAPFRRLSFVLVGQQEWAEPSGDARRALKIERRIELADFTLDEALPLAEGLGLQAAAARRVLAWALEWTGGHPYLTQRLCQAVTAEGRGEWSRVDFDHLVAKTFFGDQGMQEAHLRAVRDQLLAPEPGNAALLTTYRAICKGRAVADTEQSAAARQLKQIGVARAEGGLLRPRNRIYARVFDERWARAHTPMTLARRARRVAVATLVLVLLLLAGLVGAAVWSPPLLHATARQVYPPAEQWLSAAERAIGEIVP